MIGFWLCPTCIGIHIAQVAEASWAIDVITKFKKVIYFSALLHLITFYLLEPRRCFQLHICRVVKDLSNGPYDFSKHCFWWRSSWLCDQRNYAHTPVLNPRGIPWEF
jgi:hypothetical protein